MPRLERDTWYTVTPDYKEAHLARTSSDFYCGRAIFPTSKVSRHDHETKRCAGCKSRKGEEAEWEKWDTEYRSLNERIRKPDDQFTAEELRKHELMAVLDKQKVMATAAFVASYFGGEFVP